MNPRKLDLQQSGLRRVIASALSAKSHNDPDEIATQRWGAGRPSLVERAGVSGSVSGDASPFATESAAFFEAVSADSVVAALPLRKVPFHARLTSIVTGATGSWSAESLAKPVTRMTLAAGGLEPRKVSSLVVCSDELLADPQGEQAIMADLRRAVSDALDLAFLSSSAATASTPAGILNGVSVTASGGDVQGSVGALVDAFSGDLRRAVFVARPEVLALASVAYPRCGLRGGFMAGAPAVSSPFAPADVLILLDPGLIAFAGGTVETRASKNASIEMDSAPVGRAYEGGSPEGSNPVSMVSMFQSNSTAILVEAFCSWSAQSNSVAVMSVSHWAGVSP